MTTRIANRQRPLPIADPKQQLRPDLENVPRPHDVARRHIDDLAVRLR